MNIKNGAFSESDLVSAFIFEYEANVKRCKHLASKGEAGRNQLRKYQELNKDYERIIRFAWINKSLL